MILACLFVCLFVFLGTAFLCLKHAYCRIEVTQSKYINKTETKKKTDRRAILQQSSAILHSMMNWLL